MKSGSPLMAALPAAIVAVILYAFGQILVRAVGPGGTISAPASPALPRS
jgi:hypothetical protein